MNRVLKALAQAAILFLAFGCAGTEVRDVMGGHSPTDLDRADEALRIVIRGAEKV